MDSKTTTVQSVDRALQILDLLQEKPGGLGVTELSKLLDVAKSTTHRLLSSLQAKGFVKQDKQTGKYSLGLRLVELGNEIVQSLDIRKVASPYLSKLVGEIGETAHLVIHEEGEVVYIDKLESTASLRMYSQIGRHAPLHCTGVGKAMAAYLPENELEWIIQHKGLKKFTHNTVTTKAEFMKALQEIRNKGFSIDDEEHELGIRCAAAPIFNNNQQVVAGISVAGPAMRMTDEKLESCAQKVTECANEISALLGYRK
ncbi:IclR family transcriptional regulator [Ferviditalea candida]|uniref:IclR family transcriptional regulator n=1 Tax=Ferviditalea candida TaxID=3108399 RepID=A0ABU5ZLD9_9BACL|nr:IclR family transcriptional regulator [Paenibacillaceae bacterium T2]